MEQAAETVYLENTYRVGGVIRKISGAIGSKEAMEIYSRIEEASGTQAAHLIKLSIEFQFKRKLDIESVKACHEKLKNNAVCLRILKEMVIQHIYMFPVEYKVKQQLSSAIGLSVKGQRMLDIRKEAKA